MKKNGKIRTGGGGSGATQREQAQAEIPSSDNSASRSPRLSKRREWAFRLVALSLPIVAVLLVEVVLRVAGYGYTTSYFIRTEIAGEQVFVENQAFTRRFFPEALARSLHPVVLPVHKDPDAYRIFVLGESAAMGDPEPAYGVARFLEVMLWERYPGVPFEVVNVAVTAINSHVVREIAREAAGMSGDLWVVYMGNNEVVGPFGAGTVFGPQAPRHGLIRLRLSLQRSRVGQLFDNFAQRLRGADDEAPTEWRGLELFIEHKVAEDDPRMDTIYGHFERNLDAILGAGRSGGVDLVLSTVAVNLRECPPFGSAFSTDAVSGDREAWNQYLAEGMRRAEEGDFENALAPLRAAVGIESGHAETQFNLAEALLAAEEPDGAYDAFVRARDLDTLRVRADSRLNEIIRRKANSRGDGLAFFDAESHLASAASLGIPGEDLFYEHVHLTFEGNYHLAAGLMHVIEERLPERIRARAGETDISSPEACARLLAFTSWEEARILEYMRQRLEQPPFNLQTGHSERLERIAAERASLLATFTPTALEGMKELYQEAIARAAANDWTLRERFARFLESQGQLAAAEREFESVIAIVPQYTRAWFGLGEVRLARGRYNTAADAFEEVLRRRPGSVDALNGMGMALAGRGRLGEAIGFFREAAERNPGLALTRVNWGLALARQGLENEAIEQYRRALEIDPANDAALINLGQLFGARGDRVAAIRHYRLAIAADPTNAIAHFNLGNALSAEDSNAATESYAEAVRLNPALGDARYNYGIGLARAGRIAEAAEQFRETVRLQPHRINARLNLGIALTRLGDRDEAARQFQEILAMDPENTDARQWLAQIEGT